MKVRDPDLRWLCLAHYLDLLVMMVNGRKDSPHSLQAYSFNFNLVLSGVEFDSGVCLSIEKKRLAIVKKHRYLFGHQFLH